MIVGHGIDLIEVDRVQRLLDMPSGDWVLAAFTAKERNLADPPPQHAHFFAGRYAAKEAVAKALGTDSSAEIAWMGIEIL